MTDSDYDYSHRVSHQIRIAAYAKEARAIESLRRVCGNDPSCSSSSADNDALLDRLDELHGALMKEVEPVPKTDDPTELTVSGANSVHEMRLLLREQLPKRLRLKDVVRVATTRANDTRGQDTKDLERDSLMLGEDVVIHGAALGYEGTLRKVCEYLIEVIDADDLGFGANSTHPEHVIRFARVLVNATNRTTSGGDAFEAIERFLRAPQLVFVAPDSKAKPSPMQISCKLGAFHCNRGWDYGLIARTDATTKYLMFDVDDVDRARPIAAIEARCVRKFGLMLPLPSYDEHRVFADDGKSQSNRADFECDDGGVLELSCSVMGVDGQL